MKIQVKIPDKAKILVNNGDKVNFKTPLYSKSKKRKIRVPLSSSMGFKPDKIFRVIKKVIGDELKKGDILAEHKDFFSTKRYLSEVNGIIREIDHINGFVVIEENSDGSSICNCHFTGTIDGVYDGYLELDVEDARKVKVNSVVSDLGGIIFYHLTSDGKLTEDEVNGACIFVNDMDPIETTKLETLGAKAIILNKEIVPLSKITKIIIESEEDFKNLESKKYPYLIVSHEPNTVIFYK